MDVEDVFPRRADSVGAMDISRDSEALRSSGFSKSVSDEWGDSTAVDVSFAVVETFTWISGVFANWSFICLRRVDKVLDFKEACWLHPAVSGPDFDRTSECIGVVKSA